MVGGMYSGIGGNVWRGVFLPRGMAHDAQAFFQLEEHRTTEYSLVNFKDRSQRCSFCPDLVRKTPGKRLC